MIWALLIIFGSAFAWKVFRNISKLFETRILYNAHTKWVQSGLNTDFLKHKNECILLFEDAGIADRTFITKATEYNYAMQEFYDGSNSTFKSFPNSNPDAIKNEQGMFQEAKYEYRRRLREAFCPVFWIDRILFSPVLISSYFGLQPEEAVGKLFRFVFTAIFWIIGILVNVLCSIFGDQIHDILVHYIKIST